MKIGLTCYPGAGGSGILGTEPGKQLALRGHEVHFITSSPPIRLIDYFGPNIFFHQAEELDYPVFKYPPYSLSLAAKMAEIAESVPLDLLHVHYAIPHAASAYIARQMLARQGLATVTTLHGTDVTLVGSRPGFIPLTRFFIEKSDGVSAVSYHLREITRQIFDVKREIEVIYNFVDTGKFKPEKNLQIRRQFAPDDHKILIHISNFRPVKRVLNTIRVFAAIRKKVPATLLMVGDGIDFYPANKLVKELGLEQFVKFLGKERAVEKILPVADLFIINSVKESFGLTVLEAASCGVPALVTNVGGLPEVVVDGITGSISPPEDVEHMAKKGIELLENQQLLEKMSHQARKRAVEKFDVDVKIPEYEKLYQKILKEKIRSDNLNERTQ